MPYGGFYDEHQQCSPRLRHRPAGDWREAGDYILLTVSDTGHGIDAAGMEHLFVPFFSTKKDRPGSGTAGLGWLWFSGVVNAHSWGICSSEVGQVPGRRGRPQPRALLRQPKRPRSSRQRAGQRPRLL